MRVNSDTHSADSSLRRDEVLNKSNGRFMTDITHTPRDIYTRRKLLLPLPIASHERHNIARRLTGRPPMNGQVTKVHTLIIESIPHTASVRHCSYLRGEESGKSGANKLVVNEKEKK